MTYLVDVADDTTQLSLGSRASTSDVSIFPNSRVWRSSQKTSDGSSGVGDLGITRSDQHSFLVRKRGREPGK